MSTTTRRRLSSTSLLLLALAFIAAVIVSNQLFSGWRIDLTENNLYTLSDGTQRILEDIEEPINLYFYFSDQATANLPNIRGYANRIREMLEEFEAASDGMIKLHVVDPVPFSVEEDRAAQFGLQGVQSGMSPDPIYMGLAGTNAVDDEEVIRFFDPEKEQFLEYDIARLVSVLAHPERTVIGVVSGVSMSGDFNPQLQQMEPPWVVYTQAQQLFELRDLGTDFKKVDDDIGLLWIVQPKNLSDETLYAIDQFMMRGGKALIFVDPLAEADVSQPPGMAGMPAQGQGSNLPKLFDAWGVKFSTDEVVADAKLALRINGRAGRPMVHPGLLGITAEQRSADDVVTGDLEIINVGTAGHFEFDEDKAPTVEPLITSSDSAETLSASRFRFLPDPETLLNDFAPTGERYVIAARLSGPLKSAFPDGPPGGDAAKAADGDKDTGDAAAADTGAGDDAAGDETEAAADVNSAADDEDAEHAAADGKKNDDDAAGHLGESVEPANIVLVADVDLLSNRMWVQLQDFFGQQLANAFADNGTFVVNALENLSGSNDLIAVRSRASYSRPFTRVEALRAEAQAKFQQTQQRLQQELDETERRLSELQASRSDTGNILMTPEQQAEVDRFIDRRAEIRQELRAVQRNLDRDIEQLGTALKIINIALVPVLLIAFVLFAAWRRKQVRRARAAT